jgi:integrase
MELLGSWGGKPPLARFLAEKRDSGLSAWSCRSLMTPIGRIFGMAVRRGYIHDNPLRRLESSELPKGQNKDEARVLTREELAALLSKSPDAYKPVIATLVYTGLRMQECLGLIWEDVDFEANLIRVRHQLTRASRKEPAKRVRLKTNGSRREIRMEPDLAAMLKRHKLASSYSQDHDYVFTTSEGTPFYYRNVAVPWAPEDSRWRRPEPRGQAPADGSRPAAYLRLASRAQWARCRTRLASARARSALDHHGRLQPRVRTGTARRRRGRQVDGCFRRDPLSQQAETLEM